MDIRQELGRTEQQPIILLTFGKNQLRPCSGWMPVRMLQSGPGWRPYLPCSWWEELLKREKWFAHNSIAVPCISRTLPAFVMADILFVLLFDLHSEGLEDWP